MMALSIGERGVSGSRPLVNLPMSWDFPARRLSGIGRPFSCRSSISNPASVTPSRSLDSRNAAPSSARSSPRASAGSAATDVPVVRQSVSFSREAGRISGNAEASYDDDVSGGITIEPSGAGHRDSPGVAPLQADLRGNERTFASILIRLRAFRNAGVSPATSTFCLGGASSRVRPVLTAVLTTAPMDSSGVSWILELISSQFWIPDSAPWRSVAVCGRTHKPRVVGSNPSPAIFSRLSIPSPCFTRGSKPQPTYADQDLHHALLRKQRSQLPRERAADNP
jgi:hypothetical protein